MKNVVKDIYILGSLGIEIKKYFYWQNIDVETFCHCASTQALIPFHFKGKSLNGYSIDVFKNKN